MKRIVLIAILICLLAASVVTSLAYGTSISAWLGKIWDMLYGHPFRFISILACGLTLTLLFSWFIPSIRGEIRDALGRFRPSPPLPLPALPPPPPNDDNGEYRQKAEILLRKIIWINAVILLLALASIAIGTMTEQQKSWNMVMGINPTSIGISFIIFQVWYALMSIKVVNIDEQAIVLFFGKIVAEIKPSADRRSGLVFVPFGICSLVRAPTGMIEKDLPADPRSIWHGDATKEDSGAVPPGYVPAIRVTFAPNPIHKDAGGKETEIKFTPYGKTEERVIPPDDAYLQRNTAEVESSYGWKIYDLKKLAVQLGTKNTIEKAQSLMDDTAIGTFNGIFSKITAAEANTLLEDIAKGVCEVLENQSKDWGINIAFFRIKPFLHSHDLNRSVTNANIALQTKRTTITTSEGDATKIENLGKANAAAEEALLKARAIAESERAKVAASPGGQFAMGVEAIQRGLETARAVIVPADNLLGSIAGISTLIESMKQPPAPPPNNPQSPPAPPAAATTPPPVPSTPPRPPQPPQRPRGKGRRGGYRS